MRYRKRPVEVEAVQWTGDNYEEVEAFLGDSLYPPIVRTSALRVKTLEGSLLASKGDWLIRGIKGEFYPCKPDIFEQTYEPVLSGTESLRDAVRKARGGDAPPRIQGYA